MILKHGHPVACEVCDILVFFVLYEYMVVTVLAIMSINKIAVKILLSCRNTTNACFTSFYRTILVSWYQMVCGGGRDHE